MSGLRLQKRGKTWRYSFDGAKINGKRQFISKSGFRTKREAIIAGTEALEAYNRAGLVFNPVDISFADYLDFWMNTYAQVNCKPITVANYEKKIRLHIKPALGKYRLASLNPAVIQKLIDDKFNQGYSRNTLATIKGILTGSLSYAVHPLEYIKASPAVYVKLPSTRAIPQTPTRTAPHTVLSREQMSALFQRFPEGTSSHLPLMIGYKCGLRIAEAFALTWDSIDLEHMRITIDKQVQWCERDRKTGQRGHWYFTTPKYNSIRTIGIPSDLAHLLQRERFRQLQASTDYGSLYINNYIDGQNILNTEGRGRKLDLVMVRMDGSYIISRNMQHVSQVARNELGMDQFDYHSLRHTHATMLAESGASPKYVQHRLGHKNIQVTMQIYQHLTQQMEEIGDQLLDQL